MASNRVIIYSTYFWTIFIGPFIMKFRQVKNDKNGESFVLTATTSNMWSCNRNKNGQIRDFGIINLFIIHHTSLCMLKVVIIQCHMQARGSCV